MTFAGVGDGMVAVALPLLAAGLTRDALLVAGVVAVHHLPAATLAAFDPAAVVAADQRTVLGLGSTLRAAAAALVGLLALAGVETLLVVVLAAVVLGLGEALAERAEDEVVLDPNALALVPRWGMLGLAAVGLPLGGVLFTAAAGVPFLGAMGVFAIAGLGALTLARGGGRTPAAPAAPLPKGTATGVRIASLVSGAGGAVLGVLVLFVLDELGVGSLAFALVLVAMAGAAALGAAAAPALGQLLGLGRAAVLALVVAGGAYAGAGLVADPASPVVGMVLLAAGAGAGMTGGVLLRAGLHLGAPPNRHPEITAALRRWLAAAVPLGALAGGMLGRSAGVSVAVIGAGAVLALSAAAALGTARRGHAPVVEKSG